MNSFLKRIGPIVAHNPLSTSFLQALERLDNQQPHLLRVLTYHRVDEPDARPWLYPRIMVTPQAFDQQMRFLAANYCVLSMPELLELWQTRGSLPPRAALITFDDAYCDFAEHAWPILQRYHLPVTLFVPTAFPDQSERVFWWDWLYQAITFTPRRAELSTPIGPLPLSSAAARTHTFSRLRDYVKSLPHVEAMDWVQQICETLGASQPQPAVLGWDALRQLARAGVTLGAHTQTHPMLNRITLAQARAEAVGALDDLQREIGVALPIFAYPSGDFNAEVVTVLQQAGFTLAFGTARGLNDWRQLDCLRLRRINVGWHTSLPLLRAQLLSWARYLN